MITPLRNRVIVRPLVDKQSGTIIIPEQHQQSQTAEVVSVGPGLKIPIEIGDTILLHPNAAWTNVDWNGEELRVVNGEFILAVMETA